MSVKNFLKELNFTLEKSELDSLKAEAEKFVDELKKRVLKSKIDADVFIGGSLAKDTLVKAEVYDVDIFVRFDWKYEDLSFELEKILEGLKAERVHGSRDYFRIQNGKVIFEVIPVLRIKKPNEA